VINRILTTGPELFQSFGEVYPNFVLLWSFYKSRIKVTKYYQVSSFGAILLMNSKLQEHNGNK
jgi:hypothetical protein